VRTRRRIVVILTAAAVVVGGGVAATAAGLAPSLGFAGPDTHTTDAAAIAPARTAKPTAGPEPTTKPTRTPTAEPITEPAARREPTTKPTRTPTAQPTPTTKPTRTPTAEPSHQPTAEPAPKPPALLSPGTSSDRVRDLEARLVQVGWLSTSLVDGYYGTGTTAAVTGFQHKRGLPGLGYVDAATWDALQAMTTAPTRDQLYPPTPTPTPEPDGIDPRCTSGRVLCIDKSTSTLRWLVDGKQLSSMSVRFGCSATPTREGTFWVFRKIRDGVSDLYGSRMPFAMYFSGGEAVHYSADFAARGYNGCSHGCVNVRDWDAIAALYDQVQIGDKVVVYWS